MEDQVKENSKRIIMRITYTAEEFYICTTRGNN